MSLPNIPDITPDITVSKKDAINLLLISIAMEEIGLSHVINAEGEKLQRIVCEAECIDELIAGNKSVEKTLRTVVKKEMLLQFKLEDILEMLCECKD